MNPTDDGKTNSPTYLVTVWWKTLRVAYRVIEPARASFLASALVPILFCVVLQGQELLRRTVSPPDETWTRSFLLFGALFLAGGTSWAWARFLLNCDFGTTETDPASAAKADRLRMVMRRTCGVIPPIGLSVAFLFLGPGDRPPWKFGIGGTSGLLIVFVLVVDTWIRNRRGIADGDAPVRKSVPLAILVSIVITASMDPGATGWHAAISTWIAGILWTSFEFYHRIDRNLRAAGSQARVSSVLADTVENRFARRWIVGSVVVSVAVFVALTCAPVVLGGLLGSPAIVLVAIAIWISLGSVLIYWGHRYSVPIFTMLAGLVIASGYFNDNHTIRVLGPERMAGVTHRLDIAEALKEWKARVEKKYPMTNEHRPLYLVASAGGGIRAAYWTAIVLGRIEDEARTNGTSFADHCFAMSGVSGGSLGELTFAALLAHPPLHGRSFFEASKTLLQEDFLSADLSRMAYGDMLQRAIPVPFESLDRARALEDAWARPWNAVVGTNAFDHSIEELYRDGADRNRIMPHLLLNGTSVETGGRILTSDLEIVPKSPFDPSKIPSGDFIDVIPASLKLSNAPIRLSTAAHQSARFTYFSPAGRFPKSDSRIVDGGYFENSGAATAAEVVAIIETMGWTNVDVHWILIDNEPIDLGENPKPPGRVPRGGFLDETLAPVQALLKTRDAHGRFSFAWVETEAPDSVDEFRLYRRPGTNVVLPLGWTLSLRAMDEMVLQLTEPFAEIDHPAAVSKIVKSLPLPAEPAIR